MKIVFWSPVAYSGRKSSNLLLFALQSLAEEGGEQLILHTDYEGSGAEHFLLSGKNRRRMIDKKEFGVDFLCRVLQCERFTKEAVVNASYTFADGKLHVLPAGNSYFYQEREPEAAKEICAMVERAAKEFQNVWLELPAGNSPFSNYFLSFADCVIVNIAQSPCELEKMTHIPLLDSMFFVVGAYEKQCIYTLHNLALLYPQMRGRSAAVPYQTGYFTACCEGKAEHFWMREKNKDGTGTASYFLGEVEKAYAKWKEWMRAEHVEKDKEETKDKQTGI